MNYYTGATRHPVSRIRIDVLSSAEGPVCESLLAAIAQVVDEHNLHGYWHLDLTSDQWVCDITAAPYHEQTAEEAALHALKVIANRKNLTLQELLDRI